MVAVASGLDTVIVRVTAGRGLLAEESAGTSSGDDASPHAYRALIYSRIDLPFTRPADPPADEPATWSGEQLAGVEQFVVDWAMYNDYLASYVEGGKQAEMMRERLFEAVPEALADLLQGGFAGPRPSRTWFHSEAPELAELPWELLAYRGGRRTAANASFVRGLPPDAASPLVPVSDGLRLGLIDPEGRAPAPLTAALGSLAGIEVRRLDGDPRAALQQAVSEGFELLHVVSDGSVTSSLEGVLDFPRTDEASLASGELSRHLHGSRVRLLGLTPAATDDPASTSVGRWVVPAAHRAFTYLATSNHPLPTTVAPLGPLDDWSLERFWTEFYGALGESHEIEASMARAQADRPVAMALFLRQLQVPTFRHVAEAERPHRDPSATSADLESSIAALDEIQALKRKLNLKTTSLDAYVERESARQSVLASEVSAWVEGVDEE